jgi:hypothetical protein
MALHLLLCGIAVTFGAILIAAGTRARAHRERGSHDGTARLVIGIFCMAIPLAYTIALFGLAVAGITA